MALVYYECPMLCTMVLNGLTSTLRVLEFDPGKEFEVVCGQLRHQGDSGRCQLDQGHLLLARYDRPGTDDGWHFLTGGTRSPSSG